MTVQACKEFHQPRHVLEANSFSPCLFFSMFFLFSIFLFFDPFYNVFSVCLFSFLSYCPLCSFFPLFPFCFFFPYFLVPSSLSPFALSPFPLFPFFPFPAPPFRFPVSCLLSLVSCLLSPVSFFLSCILLLSLLSSLNSLLLLSVSSPLRLFLLLLLLFFFFSFLSLSSSLCLSFFSAFSVSLHVSFVLSRSHCLSHLHRCLPPTPPLTFPPVTMFLMPSSLFWCVSKRSAAQVCLDVDVMSCRFCVRGVTLQPPVAGMRGLRVARHGTLSNKPVTGHSPSVSWCRSSAGRFPRARCLSDFSVVSALGPYYTEGVHRVAAPCVCCLFVFFVTSAVCARPHLSSMMTCETPVHSMHLRVICICFDAFQVFLPLVP